MKQSKETSFNERHPEPKAKDPGHIVSLLVLGVIALFLAACGDDGSKTAGGTEEDAGIIAITDKMVSGVSQKGPFANGSSVTVYELDGKTLAQTGSSFEGKIKNDLGEFSVKVVKLASQYALLKANGFYRNEITGEKSNSQITLYALTDLSDRDEVNVNLLTHLAYERSLYLATEDSLSVVNAKKQAEGEVFKSFGIEGVADAAEDLNIFGESDQSAALLAVSILMQGNLKEADFSERLNDYAQDIEADGVWDDAVTATQVADWAAEQGLGAGLVSIRGNVQAWNSLAGVPDFEKYVNNFWYQNYGLGTCDKKREGEVKKNQNAASVRANEYFICKSGTWHIATTLEFDTYKQNCDEDGKTTSGNVTKGSYLCNGKTWREADEVEAVLNGCIEKREAEVSPALGTHYICENRKWRIASDIEKDTYKWLDPSVKHTEKDGDVRYGDVVKSNCYVFEDKVWRSGNESDCSLNLRGCTKLRQDAVGLGADKVWYTCSNKSWRNATNIEKDTATWGAGTFNGEVRTGQVNKTIYYIYGTSNNAWRNATTLEKDTYDYTNNMDWLAGTDGEIKKGSVTDSVYVYDASAWRTADDIEKTLGGCVAAIADSIGKVGSVYYICTPRKWVVATALQYDTYKKECLTDGSIVDGNVISSNKYVCDDGIFRAASVSDLRAELGCTSYTRGEYRILSGQYSYYKCETEGWTFTTEKLNQGTMTDDRDGHIYKTIGIKTQMWMAENLNYADSTSYPSMLGGSWCHNNDIDSCTKYGRLYTWNAAIDYAYWSNQSETCAYGGPCNLSERVRGACPVGWHLPTRNEWGALLGAVVAVVGKATKACSALRSSSGWFGESNGSDVFGFTALPAGHTDNLNYEYAMFWSSTEYHDENCDEGNYVYCGAYFAKLRFNNEFNLSDAYGKNNIGLSVRCVKDEK